MIELTHAGASVWTGGAFSRVRAMLLPGKPPKGARMRVLDDISLWIGKGEAWAVLGGKAAGKTALLKLIAGRMPPDAGTLFVRGRVAAAIAGDDGLLPHETGAGNLRLSLIMQGEKEDTVRARIKDAERLLGATALESRAAELDDEGRAQLCIGLSLASKPDVLAIASMLELCSLPFQQACVAQIRRMRNEGMTLLLECSDKALVSRLCESALRLEAGRLLRIGPLESVYPQGSLSEAAKKSARGLLEYSRAAFSAPLSPPKDKPAGQDEITE